MFDYEVSESSGEEAGLALRGELRGDVPAERLKKELERHFIDDGVRSIRVDMSALDVIDLEGIGVLLVLWREADVRGKRLVVSGAEGQVRAKLAITGLLGLLEDPDSR